MYHDFFLVALGVFGLVFGSFANVVIWRLPRGESLSSPGSHCVLCGRPVRWYDNVPVLSWVVLGGRCRDCRVRISGRYPLVEALSGALWVLAGWRFGLTLACVAAVGFFYVLLILAFIDLDTYRLPDSLVGLLAAFGLVFAAVSQSSGAPILPLVGVAVSGPFSEPLPAALVGAVAGAGVSFAVAVTYQRVRGRAGFGMGDVKLLGAMGLHLGLYVALAFFLGSALGSAVGLVHRPRDDEGVLRFRRIPFGPFLAISGVATVLAGPQMWGWYLRLVGM
ncbi:MAG: prepilin peptidase [Coriobacteriia bacterium]